MEAHFQRMEAGDGLSVFESSWTWHTCNLYKKIAKIPFAHLEIREVDLPKEMMHDRSRPCNVRAGPGMRWVFEERHGAAAWLLI